MKLFIILTTLLSLIACASNEPTLEYDIIIRNGLVNDGSGEDTYSADIGIIGDTIVAIAPYGKLRNSQNTKEIDATGKMVSPGFIDLHSHAEWGILRTPDVPFIVKQGVTTILGGNCGGSPVNIGNYFERLSEQGSAINVALLIGHNSVRRKIMQRENRHATDTEIAAMQTLVSNGIEQGAFGLSSGLLYIPGTYAPPSELEALASVAQAQGGFYATHMRSEGEHVIEAVEETVNVAKKTGIPVHISHHKTSGPSAWGLSKKTLALVDSYNAEGLDVTLDLYPYTASNTNLGVLLPSWSLAGGDKAFEQRINDPELKQKIIQESADIIYNQRAGDDLNRIQISRYVKNPEWEGKTFAQVLTSLDREVTPIEAANLAVEIQLAGGGRGIYHTMKDDDVERIMRHPNSSIASDGTGIEWMKGSPHPRNYGTYPRVLAHYVRDKSVLSLPEAIKKMTSMPAQRMGLSDRGLLKEGYKADIIVWDANTIQDKSTFAQPHQYSVGIEHMLVNGKAVLQNSELTGVRAGVAVRK
ncbi:N-acyl-D-amino-acid deacylase family protein [Glaciecola sp. 1036]|uniref:N-acyl-D-amino-acid deacylase family protein n=1 Tax=Alteromonadaceae TaxID=72275 RepID=UPI003CFBC3BB